MLGFREIEERKNSYRRLEMESLTVIGAKHFNLWLFQLLLSVHDWVVRPFILG